MENITKAFALGQIHADQVDDLLAKLQAGVLTDEQFSNQNPCQTKSLPIIHSVDEHIYQISLGIGVLIKPRTRKAIGEAIVNGEMIRTTRRYFKK